MKEMLVGAVGIELKAALKTCKLLILSAHKREKHQIHRNRPTEVHAGYTGTGRMRHEAIAFPRERQ